MRLRAAVLAAACGVGLAGPTVLAFFSGGYFPEAQAWAGVAAWGLVAASLALGPRPLPGGWPQWVAIGGILGLGAWTMLSITWAPVPGSAYDAGQLVMLYAGALLAAMLLLRSRSLARWAEPALALGTVIVIGYGLAGRLLPGLLHYARSVSAAGRLEQPLTYWNAMGELAALGFVLCLRLAGDRSRPKWMATLAAAGCVPLGLGVYTSFSRGALYACLAGVVALAVLVPERAQLRALGIALLATVIDVAATSPLHGVGSLQGSLGTRESQGAIALALLLALMLASLLAQQWVLRREPICAGEARLALPRFYRWLALALICAGMGVAIAIGSEESAAPAISSGAARLTTFASDRFAYWDVALKAFAAEPFHGVGAGGWAAWWLRYRHLNDFAQDAHSLPLQVLAELGIVGLVLLLMLFGGVARACVRAMRASPALAAGPAAALVVYLVHSPLDWDWQMPAVTLVAVALAGLVLASGSLRAFEASPALG